MARLNVEDQFFRDPRLKILEKRLGCRMMAVGSCVTFWHLAQEYWSRDKQLIPRTAFDAYELPEGLLEAGFAEDIGGEIYAKGAAEMFAWLIKAKESGRKGGLASGAARTNKNNGMTEPCAEGSLEAPSSKPASMANPLTLTLTPTLTLTQKKAKNEKLPPSAGGPKRADPVAMWIDAYKEKYGARYELQAKDGKMLNNFSKARSEEQIRTLFSCFLAIDERIYRDNKHPLALFFRDLPRISVAAQTGVNPADIAGNIIQGTLGLGLLEKK